jgi:hypothetical protein
MFQIALQAMRKCYFVFTLIVAVCYTTNLFAWGKRGHGIVAEIAFYNLDDATKTKVKKYIGDMSIEQAANWMDDVRSDHKYDYMKPWHYVNVDKGNTYENVKEPNVINQISRAIEELEHKEKLSDDEIRTNLLVLFHLVGDMHQPLHCGYGDDKGGNAIRVQYKGNNTNLHRVWDTEIIETENVTLNDCIKKLKTFTAEDLGMFSTINPVNWMHQPRLQLTSVYNFKDDAIDEEYVLRNRKLIEEDLMLGGLRLAAVLKHVFKS